MLREFKEFVARGNVVDLAVAVIIGAAFGKIVTSLTDEIIMPIVGALFGGMDFSNYFVLLKVPENYTGSLGDYAALKAAGAAMIGYGAFISAVINFLIIAWALFLVVKGINRLSAKEEEKPSPAPPQEVQLLTEIRDLLKK